MNELLEKTAALLERTLGWGMRATHSEADKVVAAEMTEVKASQTRHGYLLLGQETLDSYEEQRRQAYDKDLLATGNLLEAERHALVADVRDAITAAEPLRSPAERHSTSSEKYLLGSILDEMQRARVRADLQGLTRTRLLERLASWTDEDHSAELRTVEAAVLTGDLSRLGIRDDDDPLNDVTAIQALQAAVKARRRARVPAELLEAQGRLEKMFGLKTETHLRFLRQGLGIASRPRANA